MSRRLMLRFVLVAMGLAVGIALAEGAARWITARACMGRGSVPSVFHPQLGWAQRPDASGERFRCIDGRYEYRTEVTFNGKGLRGPDRSYERSPGTGRILVLGDSITAALEVTDAELFTARLERALVAEDRPVEVVNGAVAGYGTDQQLTYFRTEGHKYAADVVLLVVNLQNDVLENDPWLYAAGYRQAGWAAYAKPTAFLVGGRTLRIDTRTLDKGAALRGELGTDALYLNTPFWFELRKHSRLVRMLMATFPTLGRSVSRRSKAASSGSASKADALVEASVTEPSDDRSAGERVRGKGQSATNALTGAVGLGAPFAHGVYRTPPPTPWRRAWQITEALLADFRERVEASGARFHVVIVPTRELTARVHRERAIRKFPVLASDDWDFEVPRTRLHRVLASKRIPFTDLTESLREASTEAGRSVFFEVDLHLRPSGHRVVAEEILSVVRPWFGPNGFIGPASPAAKSG